MTSASEGAAADRAVAALFEGVEGGTAGGLAAELSGWAAASPGFDAFVERNRDKIRKKLRTARDAEGRRDVRAELRVAALLLADRRFELAFEPYGSGKGGPDFGVTFRGGSRFNLEVTRTRRTAEELSVSWYVLGKLRQMPPGVPNALLVAIEDGDATSVDVGDAVKWLRSVADRKDEAFFTERGFDGSRGFYDRFLRLGAVYVWAETGVAEGRASLWVNRSARTAVPSAAAKACLARLRV